MQEIVTPRLELRLLAHEDVPAFVAYRRDPHVARYQSWDTSYTTADGERLVASQQDVDFGDPGPWVQVAVIDRATGALCGDCSRAGSADHRQPAGVARRL